MHDVKTIIDQLQLQPHPEGGYYRETYRSSGFIAADCPGNNFSGDRNYSTCIYYLLTSESYSAFHRIKQDEGWHFYDGAPVELHLLLSGGNYKKVLLGRDFIRNQVPQFIIPGGTWFAAAVSVPGMYSLAGCTVAPGFDFHDFEMAERKVLVREFSKQVEIIEKFTRI